MECKACGYIHDRRFSCDEQDIVEIGDDEFIEIRGSFNVKNEYYSIREVSLYACPKCKTVILID